MKINTLLSPALFDSSFSDLHDKAVVIIDILRATSTMTAAIEQGALSIYPVRDVETALHSDPSFLRAGERNGVKIEGFHLGNSPRSFTADTVQGKHIVMTTTNGTKALSMCASAATLMVASYRNIDATLTYLLQQSHDVVLFCSGWKDAVNIEDTLFAGELAYHLNQKGLEPNDDATHVAMALFSQHRHDLMGIVKKASHAQRISTLQDSNDLAFCLTRNTFHRPLVWHAGIITAV
jgi:2-phosphosulfolactate phosphatase